MMKNRFLTTNLSSSAVSLFIVGIFATHMTFQPVFAMEENKEGHGFPPMIRENVTPEKPENDECEPGSPPTIRENVSLEDSQDNDREKSNELRKMVEKAHSLLQKIAKYEFSKTEEEQKIFKLIGLMQRIRLISQENIDQEGPKDDEENVRKLIELHRSLYQSPDDPFQREMHALQERTIHKNEQLHQHFATMRQPFEEEMSAQTDRFQAHSTLVLQPIDLEELNTTFHIAFDTLKDESEDESEEK